MNIPCSKIHSGFLKIGSNGEEDDILFLDSEPISKELEYLCRKFVTVRYYISDKEVSIEQAEELLINSLFGIVNSDYGMRYSELTGYLWTDELLMVGGHNLLQELKTFDGKYLILVVETAKNE